MLVLASQSLGPFSLSDAQSIQAKSCFDKQDRPVHLRLSAASRRPDLALEQTSTGLISIPHVLNPTSAKARCQNMFQ
ncbi:hypothetical protein KCV03_g405, partial [Aureobasidium melanogenum]